MPKKREQEAPDRSVGAESNKRHKAQTPVDPGPSPELSVKHDSLTDVASVAAFMVSNNRNALLHERSDDSDLVGHATKPEKAHEKRQRCHTDKEKVGTAEDMRGVQGHADEDSSNEELTSAVERHPSYKRNEDLAIPRRPRPKDEALPPKRKPSPRPATEDKRVSSPEKEYDPLNMPATDQSVLVHQVPGEHHPSNGAFHEDDMLHPTVLATLQDIYNERIITPQDVDRRTQQYLASIPPARALVALENLKSCDFSAVRHREAYVLGVLRRSSSVRRPVTMSAPYYIPDEALAHLPGAVADALHNVFNSGNCRPQDFDDLAMDTLVRLPDQLALRALALFAEPPREAIRNPSAYFIGIVRQVERDGQSLTSGPSGAPSYIMPTQQKQQFSDSVEQHLAALYSSNTVDGRAVHALRSLQEFELVQLLSEIQDFSRFRNPNAYIMSRCKIIKENRPCYGPQYPPHNPNYQG